MFFFKLFMVLALAAYSTSNPAKSKYECDGKTCYNPLDYPPDEKPLAGNSMRPPYDVDDAKTLYPVVNDYFNLEVRQTYCKNETVSCFGGSGGRNIHSGCKTQENYQAVTFSIKTNKTLRVRTMVKTGCSCMLG